ncbi:hypothetical protein BKK54_00955 [Rodentibacter genomosp. 1]|uniref:Uncharacterized protein n=1 Tax=Rodentibacter genomosp. 1 TaxID=1908264 RepID=A0A1V3J9K1_9PAST|nr:hypothetical protein [Rodentibacter genomosp. 1]OOF51940.1 hypothetical protein BKK54_00955 [Rodentibacter genomosp. 1]
MCDLEKNSAQAELLVKIAHEAINKAKNDVAILAVLDAAIEAESPMMETVEVRDMSSAEKVRFQTDGVSLARTGHALAAARTSVELRSLAEISDEIDQLLLLTDEQDFDTLALRKLKRALLRKHLEQVRDEILMIHTAIQAELKHGYCECSRYLGLPLRLRY